MKVADPCEPKTWDVRWDHAQREEALALAHEYMGDARRQLDSLLRELDAVSSTIKDASEWLATVSYFKAMADGRREPA